MNGININEEEAKNENIPIDLNSLAYGAYKLPDLKRRKLFFYVLLFILLTCIALNYIIIWIDLRYSIYILLITTIYIYFLNSKIKIQQTDVVEQIGQHIDHPIGYYSTALTFKGILLNPVWTVIVYDHKNPPKQKSIVEIDSNTGELIGQVYSEIL